MSQGAATRVHAPAFDRVFLQLPKPFQDRIDRKLDDMGSRLADFPHYQMTGYEACRLRIGDYRVIYEYDTAKNIIYLLSIGHRREVYRKS
jgi:mRNA interferase RelE/StbE